MSAQDYGTAYQNAVHSFNTRMRAACEAVSEALGVTVHWYPEGQKPPVPETEDDPPGPQYPHVTAQFLRVGSWDARRKRLRSYLQIDVFTNQYRQKLAWQIAGQLMEALGFQLNTDRLFCEVTQTDTTSGLQTPLYPMDLEQLQGWEAFGDKDPAVTHLVSEFYLIHD